MKNTLLAALGIVLLAGASAYAADTSKSDEKKTPDKQVAVSATVTPAKDKKAAKVEKNTTVSATTASTTPPAAAKTQTAAKSSKDNSTKN